MKLLVILMTSMVPFLYVTTGLKVKRGKKDVLKIKAVYVSVYLKLIWLFLVLRYRNLYKKHFLFYFWKVWRRPKTNKAVLLCTELLKKGIGKRWKN